MLTAEQKEMRKKGLGGSDMGAICGFNSYKTPLDVYRDKLGLSEEEEENEAMYMGNKLEPVVADIYAEKTGKRLSEKPTLFHKEFPYLLANIDRMIEHENAVLEIKTTASFKKKEWGAEGTDQMPLSYLVQCAHYALIADASYVDLALLIGGNEFRIYRYTRNEPLERKLVEKATHFWNHHILQHIPPDPLTAQDTARWWPAHKPTDTRVADEVLLEKLETFKMLKQQIATLTKDHDSLKEDLQLYIGNHELLSTHEGVPLMHYKPLERTTVNAQKLKKDHPVIYNLVCKTTLYRRLDLAA